MEQLELMPIINDALYTRSLTKKTWLSDVLSWPLFVTSHLYRSWNEKNEGNFSSHSLTWRHLYPFRSSLHHIAVNSSGHRVGDIGEWTVCFIFSSFFSMLILLIAVVESSCTSSSTGKSRIAFTCLFTVLSTKVVVIVLLFTDIAIVYTFFISLLSWGIGSAFV